MPPGTVIPAGSVLVGRPLHVIRSAIDADRERLAVLRQHQTNLTDHPGAVVAGGRFLDQLNCEQGVELGTRLAEAESGEGGGGVDIDAEAVR